MTADQINGIVELDEHQGDADDRMAVMDRLLDYAPPSQATADLVGERLHPRVERAYRGDELRAQVALYGQATRSGQVSPAVARRLRHSFQHTSINDDGSTAGTGRAA